MSELQFPKDPIVGQQYDFPPYKYYWDGAKWKTMGIGYNPVNDLRDEVLPTTREAIRRSYAEAGLNLVDGSFEEGGILTSSSDALLHTASGIAYSGPIGSVAGGTDPTAVGSGYVPIKDVLLRGELAGDTGANLVKFKLGPIAAAVGDKLSSAIDAFADCGCVPNLTTDQSVQMQAAVELAAALGRPLVWRSGTYLGRIDFSNINAFFRFIADGAIFRPFSASQSEVFYCKKSATYPTVSGQFSRLNVIFEDVNISAKLLSATSDSDPLGHTDYGVNFICTSATWIRSTWQYGKIASYRGYFHQYGVFYDCTPAASVFNDSCAGMLLDSNTSNEASNENRFYGLKLFSNKNGLVIKGGFKNRIIMPTIQDGRLGGIGGIVVTSDSSGFGAEGTEITGIYSEINNGIPCVHIGAAPNTVINGCELVSAGEYIYSTHCYNLTLNDVNAYNSGAITINHPSGNVDTASITVRGGNVKPTLAIEHNGPSAIDIEQPSIRHCQKKNLTGFTGKKIRNNVPVTAIDYNGVATTVAKGVSTTLLQLKLDAFPTSAYRTLVGKIELKAFDDSDDTNTWGYSGRIQSYSIFISTNGDGTPKVFLSADAGGVDLGISTGFMAIGNIDLLSSVVGDTITINATWSGSGSAVGSMTSATIQWNLRVSGSASAWVM